MDATRTGIAVVLDRSGSMASSCDDTIGGLNTFLDQQVDDAGEVNITLAQYDNEYELVYLGQPVRRVPRLTRSTYVPRGATALLDAIGRTIDELGARLANMPYAAVASRRASSGRWRTDRSRPSRAPRVDLASVNPRWAESGKGERRTVFPGSGARLGYAEPGPDSPAFPRFRGGAAVTSAVPPPANTASASSSHPGTSSLPLRRTRTAR